MLAAPPPWERMSTDRRGDSRTGGGNTSQPRSTAYTPYKSSTKVWNGSSSSGRVPIAPVNKGPRASFAPNGRRTAAASSVGGNPILTNLEDYMAQNWLAPAPDRKEFLKEMKDIPKLRKHRFRQWYDNFTIVCFNHGIYVPPYPSTVDGTVYGLWWEELSDEVVSYESTYMSLVRRALTQDHLFVDFPEAASAVNSSSSGYEAAYSLMRLFHPLLKSDLGQTLTIPRQGRADSFSDYTDRMLAFFTREADSDPRRLYSDEEQINIIVSNLAQEWKTDFTRLVKLDIASSLTEFLPFKLEHSQIALTFAEYARQLGKDPPGRAAHRPTVRAIDVEYEEFIFSVNRLEQNAPNSSTCGACGKDHPTVECHKLIDHVVSDMKLKDSPSLRAEIAKAHRQYIDRSAFYNKTRENRGKRPPSRRVNRVTDESDPHPDLTGDLADCSDDNSSSASVSRIAVDFGTNEPSSFDTIYEDIELSCAAIHMGHASIESVYHLEESPDLRSSDSPCDPRLSIPNGSSEPDDCDISDEITILTQNRLSHTFDAENQVTRAHVDGGSQATTCSDPLLLHGFKRFTSPQVLLRDAGKHPHRPTGIGYLKTRTVSKNSDEQQYTYLQSYCTPTIPGVIISPGATSKQMNGNGHRTDAFNDAPGFLMISHKKRRSQDLFIRVGPTSGTGGLTFTEPLIRPTPVEHLEPLPKKKLHLLRSLATEHELCTEHTPTPISADNCPCPHHDILNPLDGIFCAECPSGTSPLMTTTPLPGLFDSGSTDDFGDPSTVPIFDREQAVARLAALGIDVPDIPTNTSDLLVETVDENDDDNNNVTIVDHPTIAHVAAAIAAIPVLRAVDIADDPDLAPVPVDHNIIDPGIAGAVDNIGDPTVTGIPVVDIVHDPPPPAEPPPLPELLTDPPPPPSGEFYINSLNRDALTLLWHNRLCHLNWRRLSDAHKYIKGVPKLPRVDETINCPACLKAKLRHANRPTTSSMKATHRNQGISLDFGFMVQKSKNQKRYDTLKGIDGETCYVLITDHFSGQIDVGCFDSKAPPVKYLNKWLAANSPKIPGQYARFDNGGELAKCQQIHDLFENYGYFVETTGPGSSYQNGPGERPHQTISTNLRAMLLAADLPVSFWVYALKHYVRVYNMIPHGDREFSPYYYQHGHDPKGGQLLRTFGCRVYAKPTTPRYGKLVDNTRTGVFLGYCNTMKIIKYYDIVTNLVKDATHCRFDEGMNDLAEPPPMVKHLRNLNRGSIDADKIDISSSSLEISDNPFEALTTLIIPVICDLSSLGFEIATCDKRYRGYISGILPSSTAARIRHVRKEHIGSFIVSVNQTPTFSAEDILAALSDVASNPSITELCIVLAPEKHDSMCLSSEPLSLSIDQLLCVNSILHGSGESEATIPSPSSPSQLWTESLLPDETSFIIRSLNTASYGTPAEQALGSFTRRKLKKLPNWDEWRSSEHKQLDGFKKLDMYGEPCFAPKGASVLRQHWQYMLKVGGDRKARNCCDGSSMSPEILKLANTYSSCIEHPIMRIFFALCAKENLPIFKADATNAYATAPPPEHPTFVKIDDQYADWYKARYGIDLDRRKVLPVRHALQGHPESGNLFERHISKIISKYGFKNTTQERNIYRGTYQGHLMLMCRQVDDFAIGCKDAAAVSSLINSVCTQDKVDLRHEGSLDSFNGVDVDQTREYVKVHCETYIDKMLLHHGWSTPGAKENSTKPIEPLQSDTVKELYSVYANTDIVVNSVALELEKGFSYRQLLGELIYAYVVARPDIGYAVTTMARFSDHPSGIHYDSLRRLARYLRLTKKWGIIYWRSDHCPDFPPGDFSPLSMDPSLPTFPSTDDPTELLGYVDAAHATELKTRRSVTGLVFTLCGGAVAYKSKIQPVVATSSTEAEFYGAVHAAKIAKYLRSVLSQLGYPPKKATKIFEDNKATIMMINANRPTERSRHIDIQWYAIQEWRANSEIIMTFIPGIINCSDSFTKGVGPTLHHRHAPRYMGHYRPSWALLSGS